MPEDTATDALDAVETVPVTGAAMGSGSIATSGSASASSVGTTATGSGRATTASGRSPRSASAGAAGGTATSRSAAGPTRAGRRARPRPQSRSLVDRYRSLIVGGAAVLVLAVFGVFVFQSASASAYACTTLVEPVAPAAPVGSASPEIGQVEPDMGRSHVLPGSEVRYTYCPPASGPHFNITGRGPIQPRFYGPDDTADPMGWIHNLEHGGIAILYSCAKGGCDTAELDQLRQLASNFPASPLCKVQGGALSPVIAKFDQMSTAFAAVVWDRVLFQNELNTGEMLDFFARYGERNNPEKQCQPPTATPSVTFDASAAPDASGSISPGTIGSPSPAPSPSTGASPAPSASPGSS